jgi:ABC-2 type transport system permease protein
MTFRGNFIIDTISSLAWAVLNVIFYQQIFRFTGSLGSQTGWEKYQFFAFFSTGLIINALGQMLFMTNIDEFTDMIRTGELDFLLLKPIDTQFLVSLKRIEWSSLGNFLVGLGFLIYALTKLAHAPDLVQLLLFVVYVACGLAIYYSLMISLGASTSGSISRLFRAIRWRFIAGHSDVRCGWSSLMLSQF